MSGGELAVVLASVAVVVAVGVLGAVGVSLSRSLRELRRLLGEIRRDLLPAVERIEEASGRVTGEVRRVGGLLDVAEAVSERAESLSRVTYRAIVEPFAAVASLFRRGDAPEADTTAASAPAAAGREAGTRRPSWTRRATVYLLRSGYQAASARLAARLAAVQAQRSAASATQAEDAGARGRSGDAGTTAGGASGGSPPGRSGTAAAGPSWARQLTDAVREVTDEIFDAIEESRRTLRDDRREQERPE